MSNMSNEVLLALAIHPLEAPRKVTFTAPESGTVLIRERQVDHFVVTEVVARP